MGAAAAAAAATTTTTAATTATSDAAAAARMCSQQRTRLHSTAGVRGRRSSANAQRQAPDHRAAAGCYERFYKARNNRRVMCDV